MRLNTTDSSDKFIVFGRGVLHLSVLIETMRRECYELQIGQPQVIIKEIDGGVEMEDVVDYKIPFGILGQIAHPLFVKNKLKQIFKFREKKLIKLFGKL